MLKHIILIIILTILVVLFPAQSQLCVQWLLDAHGWVTQMLGNLFTEGQAGSIARGAIALIAIPVVAGLIPALIYWAVRKHWFPYFMTVVWVVWLVQFGALMMASKMAI